MCYIKRYNNIYQDKIYIKKKNTKNKKSHK